MRKLSRYIAVYVRVSSSKQDHKSQLPDLQQWAKAQRGQVRWFKDTQSGRTMDRKQWNKLEADLHAGRVAKICVWRLDRLGRTAAGLCRLYDDLRERHVDLVSVKDGFSLDSPAGRLHARILASVAEYENEVRSERVIAGQAVAHKAGKRWGGSKPGIRKTVTAQQVKVIRQLHRQHQSIVDIARTVRLSRPTIYSVLAS